MPGDTADLVVVDRDPLTADEPALRATEVQATLLAGRLTHAR
jgi:predicted amidohydrolase YtcJ